MKYVPQSVPCLNNDMLWCLCMCVYIGFIVRTIDFKVVNAFLLACLKKLDCGRRGFLIDSYQMTAIWQGATKGLRKVKLIFFKAIVGSECMS